tara:strand:+ start:51 stop:191 length:141 start_codon:yes stop_codon:yes gene_type:complete
MNRPPLSSNTDSRVDGSAFETGGSFSGAEAELISVLITVAKPDEKD